MSEIYDEMKLIWDIEIPCRFQGKHLVLLEMLLRNKKYEIETMMRFIDEKEEFDFYDKVLGEYERIHGKIKGLIPVTDKIGRT